MQLTKITNSVIDDSVFNNAGFTGNLTTTGLLTASSAIIQNSASDHALRITQTGGGPALLVEDSTHPDSTPFMVNADGRVAIGTTSMDSEAYLHIKGNKPFTAGGLNNDLRMLVDNEGDGYSSISFKRLDDGAAVGGMWYNSSSTYYNNASGISVGTTWFPGGLSFVTNNSTRMKITSGGNVGIGTNTPSDTLHVVGTVRLQGLPVYASNAAAITGGLVVDDVYKTSTGELRIVV